MRNLIAVILIIFSASAAAGFRPADATLAAGRCWATLAEVGAAICPVEIPGSTYGGPVGSQSFYCVKNGSSAGQYLWGSCSESCPSGQERFQGNCVNQCPTGQTRQGDGSCSCGAGQEYYNNQCVAQCGPNQQRNPTTGQCEGPCTEAQRSAAVAAMAPYQDKVSVFNAPITAGLRVVDETTTTAYTCQNTCKVKKTIYVRLGNITNTSYEVKDWVHADVLSEGCAEMPASTTVTTGVSIGRRSDGGCRAGFSFGEVNGVPDCYGAPAGTPNGTDLGGNGGNSGNSGNGGFGDDGPVDTSNANSDGSCPEGTSQIQIGGRVVCGKPSSGGGGQNGSSDPSAVPGHTTSTAHSFGEAATNFFSGLQQTPIANAIGGMAQIFPSSGGVCPAPGFDIFGQHFVIDMHCTLYPLIASTLSTVMLVVFTFVGLRIIASA
jgi:hypothetical protein